MQPSIEVCVLSTPSGSVGLVPYSLLITIYIAYSVGKITTAYTHTHTHANTHTDPHTCKSKVSSCHQAAESHRPSELALGFLGTTQALRAGASKSTWGRAIPRRWSYAMPQDDGVASPISETCTHTYTHI